MRKNSRSLKLFFKSNNNSMKYYKYFSVYDDLFSKYINKKIIFVEIGILNGGSLELWRKFFGKKARIIGIDLNPNCLKFKKKGIEIFIGDQSNPEFWKKFFKKIGKVDVILDDGGHTNKQQIITTVSSIPNIKNNGMLVCEDTHASYMKVFDNPHKYSFIEFTKKLINDVNFTYPNIFKYNFSLNKFIYSIQTYESIVCFHVCRKRCFKNKAVSNNKIKSKIVDFRHGAYASKFQVYRKFIPSKKIRGFLKTILGRIQNKLSIKQTKKFFK